MKRTIICLIFIGCYWIPVFAGLPIFVIPSKEQLLSTHLLDETDCPSGSVRMHKGNTLRVNSFSCGFCPRDWLWTVINESPCMDLKELRYINHTIEHPLGSSEGAQSKIIAYYGVNGTPLASIIFNTAPDSWYCYEMNPSEHLISCANDT